MNNNKYPNFFIIGAPKSGTTSLYKYLKQHPDIFIAQKEIHYFIDDFDIKKRVNNFEGYLKLFVNIQNEKAIGDVSVWYLYSKTAAENIKKFQKKAKIIIMLRNPVDMVYSLYYQLLYSKNEDIDNFQEAFNAENNRKLGKQIPKNVSFIESLFYSEVACYATQVKRYINIFGKKNVHIIIFDNFIKNTKQEYLKVIEFLDLKESKIPIFKIFNSNKILRFNNLHNFMGINNKLFELIIKLNTKKIKRPSLENKFKFKLLNCYYKEINNLSSLLKIDLSYWHKLN